MYEFMNVIEGHSMGHITIDEEQAPSFSINPLTDLDLR